HGPGPHHRHHPLRPRPALSVQDLQPRVPSREGAARAALAGIAMPDPLVSTAWLAERLDDPNVQIVDATWFMPGEPQTGADSFAEGHIPGAVFFDIDEIADKTVDLPHMLPTPEHFARMAGQLGLRRDATVVVYDAQGLFSAPRVWWTLRVMGFPNAVVLDGGLKKWRAEGRPVTQDARPLPSTMLESVYDPDLVRDLYA